MRRHCLRPIVRSSDRPIVSIDAKPSESPSITMWSADDRTTGRPDGRTGAMEP
jgi:hypothetical protein